MPEPKARKLAIAVLAVLVVIIVIPAVALFVRGGGDQPVQIILPTPGGTDGKTASPGVGSSKESPGKPELRVYVSGEVQKPGVYVLNPGDRLEDAVAAAGGGTSDANLEAVNFALRVQDEAHYRVPKIGETPSPELSAVPDAAASQALTGDGGQSTTGPIDLNTASAELLESLPGIGPVHAGDIVADRGVNGPFLTVEQIMRVQGIGATTYTNIRDLVSVDTSP